jgi:hypothetical protein
VSTDFSASTARILFEFVCSSICIICSIAFAFAASLMEDCR